LLLLFFDLGDTTTKRCSGNGKHHGDSRKFEAGLTTRCWLVGATAAHQGRSFRLIVASFHRIASLLPPPFLHETTIKRCIGDGDGHDDNGKFGVGVDDGVLVGRSDGGESGRKDATMTTTTTRTNQQSTAVSFPCLHNCIP